MNEALTEFWLGFGLGLCGMGLVCGIILFWILKDNAASGRKHDKTVMLYNDALREQREKFQSRIP